MNNEFSILLQCPNCKNKKDYVNLGSVSSEGYIILKRQYGRFTTIMASEYSVICDCGYYIRVENGRIIRTAPLPANMISG